MAGTNAQQRVKQAMTPELHRKLRDTRRRIAEAMPVCDDAERCGISVAGQRQALQAMDQQLEQIEQHFFPSQLPGVGGDA